MHLEFEYAGRLPHLIGLKPEVIRRPSQRRFPWALASALAARSPGVHATRATRATSAANKPAAATSAAAAPSAAAKPAAAATTEAAAPSAATAPSAAAATTAAAPRGLHAAANVFPIEEMERGETDVGHFLFAKNDALVGRGIVGLRDISGGHRGCGCATHERKTQSGDTQRRQECRFGCAFPFRSLLDPWHGPHPLL